MIAITIEIMHSFCRDNDVSSPSKESSAVFEDETGQNDAIVNMEGTQSEAKVEASMDISTADKPAVAETRDSAADSNATSGNNILENSSSTTKVHKKHKKNKKHKHKKHKESS